MRDRVRRMTAMPAPMAMLMTMASSDSDSVSRAAFHKSPR